MELDLPLREAAAVGAFRSSPPGDIVLPSPERTLDLLAIMQHFGRPTRFLDFTDNPKVAAYFAAAGRRGPSKDPWLSIWAIKEDWLEELAREKLQRLLDFASFADASYLFDTGAFESCFMKDQVTFVATIRVQNGFMRLKAQSGLFVASGNITQPFEYNLRNTRYQHGVHRFVRRFHLPAVCRDPALESLASEGITEEALFPD